MQTLISISETIKFRQSLVGSVAFVPTMGALHDGHRSLLQLARERADHVICSIFVNPKQFAPHEDFAKYPRQLEKDLALLQAEKISGVFLPSISDIYPEQFATKITNEQVAKILEGESRPGHFDGVLTVVCKLFNILQPDCALFGKKDYQQLHLISRMVDDLNMQTQIVPCETLRESSGLAMSSRNAYLSPQGREQAAYLYACMQEIKERYHAGQQEPVQLEEEFQALLSKDPEFSLIYATIVARENLEPAAASLSQNLVLLAAVKFQGVRLIDNLEF